MTCYIQLRLFKKTLWDIMKTIGIIYNDKEKQVTPVRISKNCQLCMIFCRNYQNRSINIVVYGCQSQPDCLETTLEKICLSQFGSIAYLHRLGPFDCSLRNWLVFLFEVIPFRSHTFSNVPTIYDFIHHYFQHTQLFPTYAQKS